MHQKKINNNKNINLISEKITKKLSRIGFGSRRQLEKFIEAGRVSVNGEIIFNPALRVSESCILTFDGKKVPKMEVTRLWKLYKPKGTLCSNFDPKGRRLIFDLLPPSLPRVISIGRLDYNTEGLLLLTNNGEFSRKLELPSSGYSRRYKVRVNGKAQKDKISSLSEGIIINSIKYRPIEATLEKENKNNFWLNIKLIEGKNREIRNIMEFFGWQVSRLIRVNFGPFSLGSLEVNNVEEINHSSFKDLL